MSHKRLESPSLGGLSGAIAICRGLGRLIYASILKDFLNSQSRELVSFLCGVTVLKTVIGSSPVIIWFTHSLSMHTHYIYKEFIAVSLQKIVRKKNVKKCQKMSKKSHEISKTHDKYNLLNDDCGDIEILKSHIKHHSKVYLREYEIPDRVNVHYIHINFHYMLHYVLYYLMWTS